MRLWLAALALTLGCSRGAAVELSGTVAVPGGSFWTGSDLAERARAMDRAGRLDVAGAQASAARLQAEPKARRVGVDAFHIMRLPVTHADYRRFVDATGAPEPWVDRARWARFEVGYPYRVAERYVWIKGAPPRSRAQHPVVLVDHASATAYCRWWGTTRGARGDLPTESQWERAARGGDRRDYPWGDSFDAGLANTLEAGRGGTVAVGQHPGAASPYGVEDLAGNVFEWTRTHAREGGFVVKGGSWSSDAATARCAARHGRPADLRHVSVGFRCVLEAVKSPK